MPLSEIMDQPSEEKALIEFRQRLYHRGSVPTKRGQPVISREVLDQEAARGFARSGVYRKRLAYFVDGLAIGTEQFLRDQIAGIGPNRKRFAGMRENGQYLRRRNPIPQLGGVHLSLREQRSTST